MYSCFHHSEDGHMIGWKMSVTAVQQNYIIKTKCIGLLICYLHLINLWNMKHTRHKPLTFLHTDKHRNLHVLVYSHGYLHVLVQRQKSSPSFMQTQKSSCSFIQRDTEIFIFLYTDTEIFMVLYTDRHRYLHVLVYR